MVFVELLVGFISEITFSAGEEGPCYADQHLAEQVRVLLQVIDKLVYTLAGGQTCQTRRLVTV